MNGCVIAGSTGSVRPAIHLLHTHGPLLSNGLLNPGCRDFGLAPLLSHVCLPGPLVCVVAESRLAERDEYPCLLIEGR